MLQEIGINYDADFPTHLKRGSCAVKRIVPMELVGFPFVAQIMRKKWVIDTNIPVFKDEGREYIEREIRFEND
jgi:hypothetical protein